jgi:hypothetical protein
MQDNQQQKKDQYRVWRLMASKLSGAASQTELQELHQLLQDNPHILYSMEVLTNLQNDLSPTTPVPPPDDHCHDRYNGYPYC